MLLAEKSWKDCSIQGPYNFGPSKNDSLSVIELVKLASRDYNSNTFYVEDNDTHHEAGFLSLDVSKAENVLGYSPRWVAKEAVKKTMIWYKNLAAGHNALDLCNQDIAEYLSMFDQSF